MGLKLAEKKERGAQGLGLVDWKREKKGEYEF